MRTHKMTILASGSGVLLLVLAAVVVGQDAGKAAPPAGEGQAPPAQANDASSNGAVDADTGPAAVSPADEVRSSTTPSADEVLKAFEADRPRVEPLKPVTNEAAPPLGVVDGASSDRARMPDGYLLVDRAGRLKREDVWWQLVFVADNHPETAPEPPIKLLPNQMLERMIRETQSGARDVEFVVSGEVTDFMGENYLLLRKLMRKRDLGNLSK